MPLRDELQQQLDAYVTAYRGQDAKACASFFTPNALIMSPFSPAARGTTAILDVHQEWTAEEEAKNKKLNIVEFGGSTDLAWCLVEFSEGATGQGTSLMVFERGANGAWLIRMCSLNE